jgi:hypothetical protein
MGNNSIHIKLDASEAVSLKRNILLVEKELLETARYIKEYNNLRKKEFVLKARVKKDLGILGNLITGIESHLPIGEAQIAEKNMKKTNIKNELKRIEKPIFKEKKKSDIEDQIEEIRSKLAALGGSE